MIRGAIRAASSPVATGKVLLGQLLFDSIETGDLPDLGETTYCEQCGESEHYTVDGEGTKFADLTGEYRTDPPFVCVLEDVVLSRGNFPSDRTTNLVMLPVTSNGSIPLDLVRGKERYVRGTFENLTLRTLLRTKRETVRRPQHVDYDTAYLFWTSHNYAHFLLDYLPRLRDVENVIETSLEDLPIIVRPDRPAWIDEVLETLGYGDLNFVEWTMEKPMLRVGNLVVPVHRNRNASPPELRRPSDLQWLRERGHSAVSLDDGEEYSSRVYISREDQDHWRVRNEEEVLASLQEYGFEKYKPETMSFADQITLWQQADVVVAPCGGATTSIVFSEDPVLIELLTDSDHHREEWNFLNAQQLDIDYRYLDCRSVSNDSQSVKQDMVVDCAALKRVVESALDRPSPKP
jgi:hypothetical protein